MFAGVIDVVDGLYEYYMVAPTAGFTVSNNTDGYGNMWVDIRAEVDVPGILQYLCSINTECGGINANGWYKPLQSSWVSYNQSVLYTKNYAPCSNEVCMAPVSTTAECNLRSVDVRDRAVMWG